MFSRTHIDGIVNFQAKIDRLNHYVCTSRIYYQKLKCNFSPAMSSTEHCHTYKCLQCRPSYPSKLIAVCFALCVMLIFAVCCSLCISFNHQVLLSPILILFYTVVVYEVLCSHLLRILHIVRGGVMFEIKISIKFSFLHYCCVLSLLTIVFRTVSCFLSSYAC